MKKEKGESSLQSRDPDVESAVGAVGLGSVCCLFGLFGVCFTLGLQAEHHQHPREPLGLQNQREKERIHPMEDEAAGTGWDGAQDIPSSRHLHTKPVQGAEEPCGVGAPSPEAP